MYGMYKNARNAAWQALIDNNINSLPVDVVRVVCNNGIRLLKNRQARELRCGEAGISIFDGKQWFIVYDDTMPLGRKRFTIAHELGHIFLRHSLVAGFYARTTAQNTPPTESEANIFASRFLAPACVLWGINAQTAAEIARVCEISYEAAEIRAKRMLELYKRGKFLCAPLERQVYSQFADFIKQNRLNEDKKNKPPTKSGGYLT